MADLDGLDQRPRLLRGTPMTLGRLLAFVLGGLAIAATAIVSFSALELLRDQAEEQALNRVRIAAAGGARRDPIERRRTR
jgi:hypothetical protein